MNQTATVEVLTAEVRTLQVGSRQITMSVFLQLDWIDPSLIKPFGRVSPGYHRGRRDAREVEVVGQDCRTGALTRSGVDLAWDYPAFPTSVTCQSCGKPVKGSMSIRRMATPTADGYLQHCCEWESLPLIVLAGLR